MAVFCLAGKQLWSGKAETVSDILQPEACHHLPNPPPLSLSFVCPAATKSEVRNRGSHVTLHDKESRVLRGDAYWKQTIPARLCDPDVCSFLLVISPFWSDSVTDLHCL